MANTVTQYTLDGSGTDNCIRRVITIESDGTEEADLVIFDNSAFVANVNKGRLVKIKTWGSSKATLLFEWDATTDQAICTIASSDAHECFEVGGLRGSNAGAAGATGDLLLTTSGLAALDVLSIEITVMQV